MKNRRSFLKTTAGMLFASTGNLMPAASLYGADNSTANQSKPGKAQIAITFDLEMSRHYPRRGMTEWDYQKGNLDKPTKQYALQAARLVSQQQGQIHFFLVGRVLEQPDLSWLQEIAKLGHPVGNHTYDHVNLHAKTIEDLQFRFRRAPWLVRGYSPRQVIYDNIQKTSIALKQRVGIDTDGFRTPGGFYNGLRDREDLQEILLDLGFTWVSSVYPQHDNTKPKQPVPEAVFDSIVAAQQQAQPFVYPTGLIEIPMSPVSDVTAFRSAFWSLDEYLEATRRSVLWAIETGSVYDYLCHPSCLVVEDPNFEIVKLICRLVDEHADRAELTTLTKIAGRLKNETAEQANTDSLP